MPDSHPNQSASLTSRKDAYGLTTRWDYNANDQIISITWPNGSVAYFNWDERHRLGSATQASGSVSYDYYPDDQLQKATFSNGAVSQYTVTAPLTPSKSHSATSVS